MMGEAAHDAGVRVSVLATSRADAAVATCDEVVLGDPRDEVSLRALAQSVDVITFDHELLDLELLSRLATEGVIFHPSPAALRFATDKAFQRRAMSHADLPVPRFIVVEAATSGTPASVRELSAFLEQLDAPPVVKAARGGYDGRGVAFPTTRADAYAMVATMSDTGDVVVEERLDLTGEVAQLVVRSVTGELALYPVVTTLQRDAMCVEVRYPSDLDAVRLAEISRVSERVSALVQPVGVMAVEYFVTGEGLLVNEVALRPHNSGHWTIEGTTSSQFDQHLRAVSGQSLATVQSRSNYAVMVNVVGGENPGSLDAARAVDGVTVHDYGKAWRPGRKLGHVTALGDEPMGPHVRAWSSARAYGTSTQEA